MELFKKKLSDKTIKIIIISGIAIILLIFFSSLLKNDTNNKATIETTEQKALSNQEYEEIIENKIEGIVKKIDGVGEVNILVTLQNGPENIYATEESLNFDKTNNSTDTVQERRESDQKLILIEDENGNKKPLLIKTVEPTVKGVLVVCEGGDDIAVQSRVTEAIKAVLSISSTKICVTKLS